MSELREIANTIEKDSVRVRDYGMGSSEARRMFETLGALSNDPEKLSAVAQLLEMDAHCRVWNGSHKKHEVPDVKLVHGQNNSVVAIKFTFVTPFKWSYVPPTKFEWTM